MTPLDIVMIGPFGLQPRMTMRMRALPLAHALSQRGHQVTILLPPWQNPEESGHIWEDADVRIENVPLPQAVAGWFHWRLTAHLVRRTREIDPDVVHTFKPKAYAGLAHCALKRHYPIVVDTDDWEGPGGWNDLAGYPRWLRWFFKWQERWGLVHAAAVTVASRALQTLVWSLGGPPERVFYLPNGVSAPTFTPLPRIKHKRPTILLYTRFFEYNLERLWRLLEIVRTRQPEIRVLIVGKGFAGEENKLLSKAHQAKWRVSQDGIEDSNADLVYVGWGTSENLPACFATADIAIYPFDDNLLNRTKCPVKLLDLLAAGIPVVADAVGQITEMIVEGKTGCLVQPGDEEAFATAVLDLISSPGRLERMRSISRADVSTRFAWDRLAVSAEKAYQYAIRHRHLRR